MDAHLIMNRKGNIIWNKKAEEIFGWTLKEALGASMASLIIPIITNSHKTGFQTFLKNPAKVIGQRIEIEAVTNQKKSYQLN